MDFVICSNCGLPSSANFTVCKSCGSNLNGEERCKGDNLAGAILENNYELTKYIDEGAMSWVYKGEHMKLGSSVAIKILKPAFSSDERFSKRFKKEAITASSLNHPNILSIFTIGDTETGISYIISEFIHGKPLSKLMSEIGRFPLKRTVHIISQILSALDEAHSKNIIHRDIKPENVMITKLRSGEDFIKLVDFGIAYITSETSDKRLTKYGELFGTPEYMAPETIKGNDATSLSDIYSVAMIMYEMLTGILPVEGDSIFSVLKAHLDGNFTPPSQIDKTISPAVDTLLLKALSLEPKHRFVSAMEFKRAIQELIQSKPYTIECKVCGSSLLSTHKFCPNCGAPVERNGETFRDRRGKRASLTTSRLMETMDRILKLEQEIPDFFTERTRESNELIAFFHDDSKALSVTGQTGIGKTTFINKIIESLGDNIAVYSTGADPNYLRRPWYSVRYLFLSILNVREDSDLDTIIAALKTFKIEYNDIPHLIDFIRHETWDAKNIEHNTKLRELIASITRFILALAQDKPLLLFFDDVDKYDHPSRYFINYLLQNISSYPVKVILAAEDCTLLEDESVKQLVMTRLDNELLLNDIMKILPNHSGSWTGLLNVLLKQAMGMPVHVREGLHFLVEGGSEINLGFNELVSLRIGRLPARALELLQIISLYGTDVPARFIFSDIENNDVLLNAFKVLVKRGFLFQNGLGNIQLSQKAYVKIIKSLTPSTLRQEIHKKIISRLNKNDKDYPYFFAYHVTKGLNMEFAPVALEKAADLCEKELDDYGAIYLYKEAWELLKIKMLREELYEEFATLSYKLGNMYRYTEQYKQSEDILKEGLVFAEGSPELEAKILSSLARLENLKSGDYKRASTLMNKAIRTARKIRDPELVYKVYFDSFVIDEINKNYKKAYDKIKEATGYFADSSRRPHNYWRLFIKLAQLEFQRGDENGAIMTLMNLMGVGDIQDNYLAKGRIHFQAGLMFKRMNRLNDAIPHMNKALEYLEKVGDRKGAAEAAIMASEVSDANLKQTLLKKALYLSMQIGWIKGIQTVNKIMNSDKNIKL